jgi:SAM-dependent methyltransferase
MVERVVESVSPPGGAAPAVLDVGCGTGIAGRQFRDAGCRVLGVELDPRMAAVAQRSGLEVEVGSFEEWEPAGRAFDLLISGQAWHWVDPVAGAAKASTVLRPGGRIALFWNFGLPDRDVAEGFDAIYNRVAPGLDDYSVLLGHPGEERLVHGTDGIRAADGFDEPERWMFRWDRPYTRDEWLDQLPTHSDHRLLPTDKLHTLLSEIGDEIDSLGGTFTMHYTVAVLTARRA